MSWMARFKCRERVMLLTQSPESKPWNEKLIDHPLQDLALSRLDGLKRFFGAFGTN
jgi:hypothetical protein